MRAYVDQELCIGCALCVSTCPEVYEMNADDKAQAVADTTDENREAAQEAIGGCPVSAINKGE